MKTFMGGFVPALLFLGVIGVASYHSARRLPARRCSPTSFAMIGEHEKPLAPGCDACLEKPINLESFVTDISQYLRPPKEGGTP